MADDSKDIKKNLTVFLNAEGIGETVADFNKLKKITSEAEKELEDYVKQMGFVTKVSYTYHKAALELKGSLTGLSSSVTSVMGALGGAVGLKSSLDVLGRYENGIVSLSASFRKYGIGVTELEGKMSSLSKQLHVTRLDTQGLIETYEQDFIYTNIENLEKLLVNIQKVTGANVDKMAKYQSAVAKLANLYPSLQSSIENVSESNKDRLMKVIALSTDLSLAEKKNLANYINGSSQKNKADEDRLNKAKEYSEVVGDLQSLWQDIAITVGKELMPYFLSLIHI